MKRARCMSASCAQPPTEAAVQALAAQMRGAVCPVLHVQQLLPLCASGAAYCRLQLCMLLQLVVPPQAPIAPFLPRQPQVWRACAPKGTALSLPQPPSEAVLQLQRVLVHSRSSLEVPRQRCRARCQSCSSKVSDHLCRAAAGWVLHLLRSQALERSLTNLPRRVPSPVAPWQQCQKRLLRPQRHRSLCRQQRHLPRKNQTAVTRMSRHLQSTLPLRCHRDRSCSLSSQTEDQCPS
mmetsp:Transcript_71191/g.170485  ORF Transcript_71191/g.170485 Transcript_71191/m.170485 type:complete len:236 (-) Transcript_71191:3778-4485(-)